MFDLFTDYTLRTIALGAGLIGIVSGSLGTYAVLRGQSLLGDAISHAALPGIVAAYILTGSKAPITLILGAALAGFAGTLCIMAIVRTTRVKLDSALALILSVFFGTGLVLLTWLQRQPDASQAGLDRYLFGQAAAVVERDVVTVAALGLAALAVAFLFWKELKLLSFDHDYAAALGLRVRALDILLTGLLVVAIVIGLQAVGVVLMTAMVVAPAAAARQWTDALGPMMLIAAGFGALGGVTGAVLSAQTARLPTGPTIVVCLTVLVGVSLLFAPRRGLVARRLVERGRAERLRLHAVLAGLDALAREHGGAAHGHPAATLRLAGGRAVDRRLAELERRGWARQIGSDEWVVTQAGREEAARIGDDWA
ncbi:MAG TPA: iron chelate uptake ABC transporter family permease subunit [Gaiellaceae bacterium]|nr:iron chelate uptake ABC transporter family permease subunit [Gaiellaceae bacterium]